MGVYVDLFVCLFVCLCSLFLCCGKGGNKIKIKIYIYIYIFLAIVMNLWQKIPFSKHFWENGEKKIQ
jgi:hypothetical protein